MAAIMDLPFDIKAMIFSYLDTPGDIKSAYKTCKVFYHVVIRLMYHRIDLPDTIDLRKLSRILNPDNVGIKYVRHIRIYCSKNRRITAPKPHKQVVDMLANHSPRDNLLSLR